ncbi:hypothetical protein ACJMK2_031573 [Sinanodonta woodiana]|uniref:Mitochondria-eating protein C-terminal domain-containing protein n=1 Tax=Sinanodonta woodiana TaxID=1069815 RepID=A0ABD3X0M8_SINWO
MGRSVISNVLNVICAAAERKIPWETIGEIILLKTENQYLRKSLDGLHKYIIGGDEKALNDSKIPKLFKDNQSLVEVEGNVKEVAHTFQETKTDLSRFITENQFLKKTLDGLHEYIIDGDQTTLNELKTLDDMKGNQSIVEMKANVKEVTQKFHETKTEAEYATDLLEELKECLAYEGKQDIQVGLKEPPIPMVPTSNKKDKKGKTNKNDENPKSKHSEQLQKNFGSASSVLKMLMNAEDSTAERECMLSTLMHLRNYVRDVFEGNTEGETSPSWDEIWPSIKKESSAYQGLSHAKEISSYQMEWKREAEYASYLLEELNGFATDDGKQDRQLILKQPPIIQMTHDSKKDGKKEGKKQTDQSLRSRHVEQLQRNFSSASNVLKKQMDEENAIKERECLMLALDCLFKHSRDLSEGKTEGDMSSTLDEIKSSINKERPVSQGLSHARAILNIHMEWKREVEYLACLLKDLANVSQSTNNGDNSISLSQPENFGTLRDNEAKDGKNTETPRNNPMQSIQKQKLKKHYENADHVLKQMKEKEKLRSDLGKKTEQVEDLTKRCKKLQGENDDIKKDADSLRTRLSEHAGALLTHDNPSIADLSDPNRPTKLAEKYSELYDNQWTDAFATIAKEDPDMLDDTIVGYLYAVLVDGYRFCEDVRRKQILALEDILFDPAGGMKTSQAFVMDENIKEKYRKMTKLCETYILECVQLCWLMHIQTPPLCLDLKTIKGQVFDKNSYKEYTKKGKKIAFVVWPALFLHETGAMLSKGVAQGQ